MKKKKKGIIKTVWKESKVFARDMGELYARMFSVTATPVVRLAVFLDDKIKDAYEKDNEARDGNKGLVSMKDLIARARKKKEKV